LVYDVTSLRGEEDYDGEEKTDEGERGDVIDEASLIAVMADYA